MLFNIICEILRALILIMLFLCELKVYICAAEAYKEFKSTENRGVKPVKSLFKKPKKVTEEEARLNQILYNIDNYNGSELGQKEIEVK